MKLADEMYVADYQNHTAEEMSDAERWEKERDVMASQYLEVFSSPVGQKVLKDLITNYLTQPFAAPNSTQIEVGMREGEARVIRRIIHLRDYAEGVK